jgi:hypothetical protein
MATRRSSQLTIVRPRYWQRQTAWGTPVAQSEMLTAINVTSRNYLDVDETNEEVYDCTGEDFLFLQLTGRFARLVLEMDVDPDELAGWEALCYGIAAAPSGGTNEVQTLTIAGTGLYQFAFERDYQRQQSAAVAHDALAAAILAALEAMPNIGAGNVAVAVAGGGVDGAGPYTITFQNALGNEDVALLEIISATTGGTPAVAQTTPGTGRLHAVSRLGVGLYTLPYTTLYVGYRGSSEQPVIFKNVVVNSVRVRSSSREKVTATVELIGSADLAQTVGYTMPACVDIQPVRFGDCDLTINGVSIYDPAGLYGVENGGIPVARDWEYYMQNDVLTGNHAFTGQGVDVTRLERADRRPSGLNIGALGEPNDTLYNMAQARQTVAAILRVGPTSKNVTFNIPQGLLQFDSPRVRHEGDANESHLRLTVRPKKVSGDATTPSNVTARTQQATAYLNAA